MAGTDVGGERRQPSALVEAGWETVLLYSLIPISFVPSAIGLHGSLVSLVNDIEGAPRSEVGGWS